MMKLTRFSIFQIPERIGVYDETRSMLLSIPGHAQYFADEIEREQKEVAHLPTSTGARVSYDAHRSDYFSTLAYLPSPETIKVVGYLLSDEKDTPVPEVSPDSDWGRNPRANCWGAAGVIANIGLRDAPVDGGPRWDEDENALVKSRAWWEQIKSGQRPFSFVGEKVEYRFKPDGSWETIAMIRPPEKAMRPGGPSVEKDRYLDQTTAGDSSPDKGSKAAIYVACGLLAAGLAAMGWRRMRAG